MDEEKRAEGSVDSEDSEVREAQVDYNKRYTYSDYLSWDDDERWELIDGVPYMMSAPNNEHQGILGNVFGNFWVYLKGKPCKVYAAPFDVRLNADTFDNTVVQPDVLIICDREKLNKAGCKGAPDMVVEVLSPSTSKYDRTTKFQTYEKEGVLEYWIIDPVKRTLTVNLLEDNRYVSYPYTETDVVSVHVLEGFSLNVTELFEDW